MRKAYSNQLALVTGLLLAVMCVIFALVRSPESLAIQGMASLPIPHSLEGRGLCDYCHGIKGIHPYPLKHLGWSNESCLGCHQPTLPSDQDEKITEKKPPAEIPPVLHPIGEDWEDCLECHGVDIDLHPAPADHKGFSNKSCTKCHLPSPDDNQS